MQSLACGLFVMFMALPAWALGSTPVTVVNPSDVAKAEGIQHPYQTEVDCTFNNTNGCSIVPFNVPANQRFVFEYVAGACALPPGGMLTQVVVGTQAGGANAGHRLGITDHTGTADLTTGSVVVSFGQTVRIYADPNTIVTATAVSPAGSNNGSQSCLFTFSGQAIDVP
jgi:hypothetical protein